MSIDKVRHTPKHDVQSAQDVKEEKKFFKVAIIVTLVFIVLIYLIFNYI